MKKIYILILILFCFYNPQLKSQSLVSDNNKWTSVDWWAGIELDSIYGDTVILGVNYKNLYVSYDTTFETAIYRGSLREDTTGKVFLTDGFNENLLYDFNLEVGDSFPGPAWPIVVTNIDTVVLLNGEIRKRFEFGFGHEYWIDGIGSTNGLLNIAYDQIILVWEVWLNCFFQNDTLKYHGFPTLDCFHALTRVESSANNNSFSVYPNPSSGNIEIKLVASVQNARLSILNFEGQIIKTIDNISGNKIQLSNDGLPPGIYFFSLQDNNDIIKGKFILQ